MRKPREGMRQGTPIGGPLDPYESLAAAVMRDALKGEGVAYLNTEGGEFWCDVMGLDKDGLRRGWLKRGGRQPNLST